MTDTPTRPPRARRSARLAAGLPPEPAAGSPTGPPADAAGEEDEPSAAGGRSPHVSDQPVTDGAGHPGADSDGGQTDDDQPVGDRVDSGIVDPGIVDPDDDADQVDPDQVDPKPAGARQLGSTEAMVGRLTAALRADPRRRIAVVAAALAGLGVLVTLAAMAVGVDRSTAIVPAVVGVGAAFVVAALWRFELFVVGVLVLRASLDGVKPGGGSGAVEPAMVLGYLVVVASLLWLARPRDGRWSRPSSITWCALALLGAGALSVVAAVDRVAAALDVARVAAAVALLAVLDRFIQSRRVLRAVVAAVFASAVIPVGVALFQAAGGGGSRVIDGFSRVRGTFVHPNPLALYLTLLLVMGVALLPNLRSWYRWLMLAFVVLGGGVLVATYARGAWIALVAGILVAALLQRRWWVVGLLAVGLVLTAVAVPSVAQRFADVGRADRASGDASNSLSWRVQYWDRSLDLFPESPVIGVGLGMVAARLPEGVPPHNDYIRVLVETGVVGEVAFIGLLVAMSTTAVRSVRHARDGFERGIATGYAGVVVAFGVLAITANVLTQVAVLWYLFALTAAGLGVARFGRSPRPRPAFDGPPPPPRPAPDGGTSPPPVAVPV